MDLPLIFALIAALAVGLYVVADGFDLGVGVLFLFAPRDCDRDMMMRSIAPMWDGNETWLVFGGALLWAVFPIAYYVLLPAFYLPIMAMLFALIFRGIAFGFRFQSSRFRWVWDYAFAGGSILAVLAQGFVLGGFISGVEVRDGAFAGGSFSWLTILGLLCGVGLLGGYALLGAGWLIWKTSGGTQVFGREVGHAAVLLTAGAMLLVSTWTAMTVPDVAQRWFGWPQILPLALAPLAAAILFVLVWRNLWSSREYRVLALGILIFRSASPGSRKAGGPMSFPATRPCGPPLPTTPACASSPPVSLLSYPLFWPTWLMPIGSFTEKPGRSQDMARVAPR